MGRTGSYGQREKLPVDLDAKAVRVIVLLRAARLGQAEPADEDNQKTLTKTWTAPRVTSSPELDLDHVVPPAAGKKVPVDAQETEDQSQMFNSATWFHKSNITCEHI